MRNQSFAIEYTARRSRRRTKEIHYERAAVSARSSIKDQASRIKHQGGADTFYRQESKPKQLELLPLPELFSFVLSGNRTRRRKEEGKNKSLFRPIRGTAKRSALVRTSHRGRPSGWRTRSRIKTQEMTARTTIRKRHKMSPRTDTEMSSRTDTEMSLRTERHRDVDTRCHKTHSLPSHHYLAGHRRAGTEMSRTRTDT
jgi:hypothetical protein